MNFPFMCRLRGTVILTIWWQVLLIVIYTTGLVCMHNFTEHWKLKFPQVLIPVLGIATGLLLVFRTNTASDRYHEGRKLWSTVTCNIRTLTRCFWVVVDEKEKTSKEIVEKITAINLLIAFAYSVKNYLREEYSYNHEDLHNLLRHIPKFTKTRDEETPPNFHPDERKRSGKSKKSLVGSLEYLHYSEKRPKSSVGRRLESGRRREYNYKAYDKSTPTNIPIELSYYIASYINYVRLRCLVDPSTVNIMNNALNSLVDCVGGFERILRTPIPLAYSVHLHHALWIYLLSLPFQLTGVLNWFTIPAVAVASFSLLGILSIGWEIENPFGYEANDLPMEDYCDVIRKEASRMIGHPMPSPEAWMFTEENKPLLPECQLSAEDLVKMEESDVRRILAAVGRMRCSKGWKMRLEDEVQIKSEVEYISQNEKNGEVKNVFCEP